MRCCVPHGRSIGCAFVLILALGVLACGGSVESDEAITLGEGAKRANTAPTIERISLEPAKPSPGEALRVVAQVSDAEGDPVKLTYEWLLRGKPVGSGIAKLMLTDALRGDRVEVVVVASDGRADSAPASTSVTLQNQPPTVERLGIGPSLGITAGEPVEVSPEARDGEDDALEFSYTWLVNGRRVSAPDVATFDSKGLVTGDVIRVEVRANDGEDESEPFESPEIRVINRPPHVVSKPGPSSGGGFAYEVVAEDPDGDAPLHFELEDAPAGMTIGAHSGRIHWQPRTGQAGQHEIRVIVDDLRGGRVAHVFDVDVGGSAPPASVGR